MPVLSSGDAVSVICVFVFSQICILNKHLLSWAGGGGATGRMVSMGCSSLSHNPIGPMSLHPPVPEATYNISHNNAVYYQLQWLGQRLGLRTG